ncbi:MAG: S41 family peptidase [Candidatus Hydrogenedentes bacterium]|nr:S41 family peptidase [Candidatus Hydrogenedentota bacterium]
MKKLLVSSLCLIPLLLSCLFLMQCTRAKVPLTKVEVPMVVFPFPELPLPLPKIPFIFGEGDYRLLPWNRAFNKLCNQMATEYPFAEWKNINWEEKKEYYSKLIAEAKKTKSIDKFYLALREFIYSIPDAGVRIETNESLQKQYIGGGYGFSGILTDDNKFIVFYIHPGSSAYKAGIIEGAEIVEFNQEPITSALEKVSILWADKPPATKEGYIWEKCKLIGRAPIGNQMKVAFKNPDEEAVQEVTLVAEDDDYATLRTPLVNIVKLGLTESPVQSKVIDGKIGYIRIVNFGSSISTPFPAQAYQRIITDFIREGLQKVIIDLRGNPGGDSALAVKFGGHFVEEEVYFQKLAVYKKNKKGFTLIPGKEEVIKPLPINYRGKVVVLVDYGTAGCAELLAKALSTQKRVTVLGFCSTRGSVGAPGGDIRMPRGITLSYPVACSLDKEGNIQIEADANGNGGVTPGVKVPLTSENLLKFIKHRDEDPLLSLAILNFN